MKHYFFGVTILTKRQVAFNENVAQEAENIHLHLPVLVSIQFFIGIKRYEYFCFPYCHYSIQKNIKVFCGSLEVNCDIIHHLCTGI